MDNDKMDDWFARIGQQHRRWLNVWFSVGVGVGFLGLLASVVLLLGNLGLILGFLLEEVTGSRRNSIAWGRDAVDATMFMSGESQPARISAAVGHGRALLSQRMDVQSQNTSMMPVQNRHPIEDQAEDPRWQSFSTSGEHSILEQIMVAESMARHAAVAYEEAVRGRTGLITPLLPGVNLPKNQIWYILIALFASTIFHELGHALAAGAENLRVSGVAGFIALIFPGAFVQMVGIRELPTWRQLKVVCAGAWHNIIIAMACIASIASLPYLLLPVFSQNSELMIVGIPQGSSLLHHANSGDILLSVGSEPVQSRSSFFRALGKSKILNSSVGFCMDDHFLARRAMPAGDCCSSTADDDLDIYCFEKRDSLLQVCVRASDATDLPICRSQDGCPSRDPSNTSSCFSVRIPNDQRLIDLHVKDATTEIVRSIFYQGDPLILSRSVVVSDFAPRFRVLAKNWPACYRTFVSMDFPKKIDRLLRYLFSISAALAILNMAPVFFLDGEASAVLFLQAFRPSLEPERLAHIRRVILSHGTGLLAANIILSLILVEV
eukprot:CAMPEP_0184687962 /NCGR_PEP_ID=MMETSP0312-20130426/28109_1 /TAXON_ID=31354 /ORGANISM="Compsopogon coeruleus, Strain SAG 36.94" /LENGTH=549 /DNA_ID=CAMNT_0027144617 /DNA_START=207 /DNA_END=1857 /DNA_ORIENTATION=+